LIFCLPVQNHYFKLLTCYKFIFRVTFANFCNLIFACLPSLLRTNVMYILSLGNCVVFITSRLRFPMELCSLRLRKKSKPQTVNRYHCLHCSYKTNVALSRQWYQQLQAATIEQLVRKSERKKVLNFEVFLLPIESVYYFL